MADVVSAQPGPQRAALESAADVMIFGGSAGCGKTMALLLKPLQFAHIPHFRAVLFRRTSPEITNPGGMWDESAKYYPASALRAEPNRSLLEWAFPSGAKVKFAHMQYEDDRLAWKGAQLPLIGFDQLESFEEQQFWYLHSRNRDPSGRVRPHIVASCNPVPEDDKVGGWLHKLISWWLDEATGLARSERGGVLRWFVRSDEQLEWYGSREAALAAHPSLPPISMTFVPGRLEDNPAMAKADPGYRARLLALPPVERARLLGGNWKVRPTAGAVFDRAWFRSVVASPVDARRVRYWDKAGTEGAGDWSAGVRIAEAGGHYYIEDVVRGQWSPGKRNEVMRQVAAADGPGVPIRVEQEPGSGGKESALLSVQELAGYDVRAETVTGDKVTRAGPLSAQAEAGNVSYVVAEWNEAWLSEMHGFPEGKNDDQVDGSSGAFNKLALGAGLAPVVGELGASSSAPQRVRLSWPDRV